MERNFLEMLEDVRINGPTGWMALEQENDRRRVKEKEEQIRKMEEEEERLVEDTFCSRLVIPDQEIRTSIPEEFESTLPIKPAMKAEMHLPVKVTHVLSPSEFYICPIGQPMCSCSVSSTVNPDRWEGKTVDEVIMSRHKDLDQFRIINAVRSNTSLLSDDAATKTTLKEELHKSNHIKNDFKVQHQSELPEVKVNNDKYIGIAGLYNIIWDLTNLIEDKNYKKPREHLYKIGELVAIRVEFRRVDAEIVLGCRRFYWLRGLIFEKREIDNEDMYTAYLVDYGAILTSHVSKILPLPDVFAKEPPMVYRCKLFDIQPTENFWRDEDILTFNSVVKNKLCFMEVIKGVPSSEMDVRIGKSTCEVNLTVVSINSFIDVGKELKALKTVHSSSLLGNSNPLYTSTNCDVWNTWTVWMERMFEEKGLKKLVEPMSLFSIPHKKRNKSAVTTPAKSFTVGPSLLVGPEDKHILMHV